MSKILQYELGISSENKFKKKYDKDVENES